MKFVELKYVFDHEADRIIAMDEVHEDMIKAFLEGAEEAAKKGVKALTTKNFTKDDAEELVIETFTLSHPSYSKLIYQLKMDYELEILKDLAVYLLTTEETDLSKCIDSFLSDYGMSKIILNLAITSISVRSRHYHETIDHQYEADKIDF